MKTVSSNYLQIQAKTIETKLRNYLLKNNIKWSVKNINETTFTDCVYSRNYEVWYSTITINEDKFKEIKKSLFATHLIIDQDDFAEKSQTK